MADATKLVKVAQLQTAMTRVKSELDTLDGKTFGSAVVSNGKIHFYATTNRTGTAIETVDLPEEIFLDSANTKFVQSFVFSSATYPGATDPNLNGKPVLVLAIKGDAATNPTTAYSFINLESLIKTYTAADASIVINGTTIAVGVSTVTGNTIEVKNDGLFVESNFTAEEKSKLAGIEAEAQVNVLESVSVDGSALTITNKGVNVDLSGKVDKVTGATSGNLVAFGANGALADSGYAVADDAEVATMLTSIFGAAS